MSDRLEESLKEEELQKQYIEDYTNNPKYKDFFDKYNEHSIKDFIKDMARHKATLMVQGKKFVEWAEADNNHFFDMAYEGLWEIQHKKLFNLQCLWRAEKVTIPEIECSVEFLIWSFNIKNCRFIEPITQSDIDLYIQFLNSDNVEMPGIGFGKNYDYIHLMKMQQEDPENDFTFFMRTPSWYEFYDTMRGTNSYLMLPDIRGDKEAKYMQTTNENAQKEHKEKIAKGEIIPETRPRINAFDDKMITDFVNKFEDKKIKDYYAEYTEYINRNKDNEMADIDMEQFYKILKIAEKKVPVKAHYNWKEAIAEAAIRYQLSRIIENLPKVYEEYLTYVNLGITYPLPDRYDSHIQSFLNIKEMMLDGRESHGEPRDFNF